MKKRFNAYELSPTEGSVVMGSKNNTICRCESFQWAQLIAESLNTVEEIGMGLPPTKEENAYKSSNKKS